MKNAYLKLFIIFLCGILIGLVLSVKAHGEEMEDDNSLCIFAGQLEVKAYNARLSGATKQEMTRLVMAMASEPGMELKRNVLLKIVHDVYNDSDPIIRSLLWRPVVEVQPILRGRGIHFCQDIIK